VHGEGAHELDAEGPEAELAVGGFADGGEGGEDVRVGLASAAADMVTEAEETFLEVMIREGMAGCGVGFDAIRVGAEPAEDSGASSEEAHHAVGLGVESFEEGLGPVEAGAAVIRGGGDHSW